jgi:hypothetical protein
MGAAYEQPHRSDERIELQQLVLHHVSLPGYQAVGARLGQAVGPPRTVMRT